MTRSALLQKMLRDAIWIGTAGTGMNRYDPVNPNNKTLRLQR